jgi:hypothetical protein
MEQYQDMSKPRYDKERNVSRHGAASEGDCEKMSEKYDWELLEVEKTPHDPVFEVDCVFKGETEFPASYYEQERD